MSSVTRPPVEPRTILDFWFPAGLDGDEDTHRRRSEWWFRGGADAEIVANYVPCLEAAIRGELDTWADAPRSCLALIIVLDQFSRSVYRGTPRAYTQDARAQELCLDGFDRGHYDALPHIWEKRFFYMPLLHSERLEVFQRSIDAAMALAEAAPPHLKRLYEFSIAQARAQRDVIARFGRHPHRNAVLGRASTPDEMEYLARGEFVHQRPFPGSQGVAAEE